MGVKIPMSFSHIRQKQSSLFFITLSFFSFLISTLLFPALARTPSIFRSSSSFHSFMDYFKKLPEEISLEILTRLPTESVLDSKLVCRNWRNVISHHPLFSGKQLHHLNHPSSESSGKFGYLAVICSMRYGVGLHYFEHDDQSTTPIQRITRMNLRSPFKYSRVVGSINGLVCLVPQSQIHPSVVICNPITRECLTLPEIKRDSDTDGYKYEETCYGYVSSTNEYKIVGFYKLDTCLEVHIYTLGSGNGWRNLGRFNFGGSRILYVKHRVFFTNGALYWLDDELKMIRTFDLAEEKFGEHVSPPPLPPQGEWINYNIGVLDGFLFFAVKRVGRFHDIWLWKKKNHNDDKEEGEGLHSLGWNKEFRIGNSESIQPLAVTKSDGVLNYGAYGLYTYNTKTSIWKILVKFNSYIAQASPHKNTLVSLRELGEEVVQVMDSAQIEETKSGEQLHEDADPEYIYL